MGSKTTKAPDQTLLTEIETAILEVKTWGSPGEMVWVDSGGKPKGWSMREPLTLVGVQPRNFFVECYYKPASKPGWPDKLSMSLMFHGYRVLGIDEDGPGNHFNHVGVGKPHYKRPVPFPHVHFACSDAVCGYAEPIERHPFEALWTDFIARARIIGAPEFKLPMFQLGLDV